MSLWTWWTRHNKITNKEIAQLMQVSPPAVTDDEKANSWRITHQGQKAGYLTDLKVISFVTSIVNTG